MKLAAGAVVAPADFRSLALLMPCMGFCNASCLTGCDRSMCYAETSR